MTDPAGDLQAALIAALKADAGVIAAFGTNTVRVYDVPPVNLSPPYVLVQSASVVPDLAEGMDLAETEVTITVWALTNPPTVAAAMALGQAVSLAAQALDAPAGYVLDEAAQVVRAQYLIDADGRTGKGAIAIRYATDTL